jgi:hypothetical protein
MPPIKMLSWNVQRASMRSKRLDHIQGIVKRYSPDIIHLTEVSHDFAMPDYTEIAHALSLNNVKSLKGPSTPHNQLNAKVFLKTKSKIRMKARVLRAGRGQPRAGIKVHITHNGAIITGLFEHAKASKSGGAAALAHAVKEIQSGNVDFVAGDRNADLNSPAVAAAATAGGALAAVRPLDSSGNPFPSTHKGGAALDFVSFPNAGAHFTGMREPLQPAMGSRSKRVTQPLKVSDHKPLAFIYS